MASVLCDKALATEPSFGYSDYIYRHYATYAANNKRADQTAGMRRPICAFVVRVWDKQVCHDSVQ